MRFSPAIAVVAFSALLMAAEARSQTDAEKQIAAAEKKMSAPNSSPTPSAAAVQTKGNAPWTPELVCRLSLGIGLFAVVAFGLVALLIWKGNDAEHVLRTFGILVIVFSAVFLVVTGYSESQITPVIGLLGTIAGYLLGRRTEGPGKTKHENKTP